MRIPSNDEFDDLLAMWMSQYGHLCFNVRQNPSNAVFVGKGSIWENPYRHKKPMPANVRKENIIKFYVHLKRALLEGHPTITTEGLKELKGRNLICFCNDGSNIPNPDKYCHSMVLAMAADKLTS